VLSVDRQRAADGAGIGVDLGQACLCSQALHKGLGAPDQQHECEYRDTDLRDRANLRPSPRGPGAPQEGRQQERELHHHEDAGDCRHGLSPEAQHERDIQECSSGHQDQHRQPERLPGTCEPPADERRKHGLSFSLHGVRAAVPSPVLTFPCELVLFQTTSLLKCCGPKRLTK